MEQIYLINIDDIKKFKSLPLNINIDEKINPAILEAQEFDLRPFLGDALYLAIEDAMADGFGDYAELFNGCSYEYAGFSHKHEGLRAMLAYYTFARIVGDMDATISANDIVQKVNEFSKPADEKTRARKVQQAIAGALVYQGRVENFLNRKGAAVFPLWRSTVTNKRRSSVKITGVGGKDKIGSSYRCNRCNRYSCNGLCYGNNSVNY